MTAFQRVPNDIWIEVLSLSTTLHDLRSFILSSQHIADAFSERRARLITLTLQAQLRHTTENPYRLVKRATERASSSVEDAVTLLQAIEPYMEEEPPQSQYYYWVNRLCALYAKMGLTERRLTLLTHAYERMLGEYGPNFETIYTGIGPLKYDPERKGWTPGAVLLPHSCQVTMSLLAEEYAKRRYLKEQMEVLQELYKRVPLDDPYSCRYAGQVVAALQSLHNKNSSNEEIIRYARHMFEVCRSDYRAWGTMVQSTMFWARQTIEELEQAERFEEALEAQRRVVSLLPPDWPPQEIEKLSELLSQREHRSEHAILSETEIRDRGPDDM